MKTVLRTLLIGGGILGMITTFPIAYFICRTKGILDSNEQWVLWIYGLGLPGLCVAATLAGIRWKEESIGHPVDSHSSEDDEKGAYQFFPADSHQIHKLKPQASLPRCGRVRRSPKK